MFHADQILGQRVRQRDAESLGNLLVARQQLVAESIGRFSGIGGEILIDREVAERCHGPGEPEERAALSTRLVGLRWTSTSGIRVSSLYAHDGVLTQPRNCIFASLYSILEFT